MPFNINEFAASLGHRVGVTQTNKFLLKTGSPAGLTGVPNPSINGLTAFQRHNAARGIDLWCEEVDTPEMSLQTHLVPRYSYGTYETRPYSSIFQPVTCQFIEDGDGVNFMFFQEWMNMIFNVNMSKGINTQTQGIRPSENNQIIGNSIMGVEPFELAYRDEYVTQVQIVVFNNLGEPVKNIRLRDAFPKQMNSSRLNWSDNNTYSRIQVAFAYTDWYLDYDFETDY